MTSSRTIATFVAAVAIAASHAAAAQGQEVSSRFPDVAQVNADYPDDAERFIVFDILFNRLGEAKREAQVRTDYRLASGYLGARNDVLTRYEQQGRDSEAYKTFTARNGSLFSDPGFRRSVLEKYALTDLTSSGPAPSGGSLGSTLFPERIGDTSDAEIKAAFYEALPIWGGTMLGMLGLTWLLMRWAGDKTVKAPPRADSRAGLPELPESLSAVDAYGRRYEVVMASGLVIGTSANNAQQDVVWVRTPDQRETSWTISGGVFKTRQGHVVSTIERPLPGGVNDVLLAYNHTTDQLELFPGVSAVHATRLLFPWFVVALTGSIPGAVGLGLMFHRLGGLSTSLGIALLTLWIMGGLASTIIAAFVALRTKVKIETRRTEAFLRDYIPEYRRFFSESTPALTSHFAKT